VRFTQQELTHLLISVITITLAFALVFKSSFFIILVTVGLGFFLHEMGHKFTADKFRCWTKYQAWIPGLVAAIGLAIVTNGAFIFAAPGWVAIYKTGGLTRKENGLISVAGPVVNIILALVFLWIGMTTPISLLKDIGLLGFSVNSFLGFFNMLPFGPLDGKKVAEWNIPVWLIVTGALAYMTFVL